MSIKVQIAIDGPAGSGKSTVARRVAKALGYLYIDSGAWYRAVVLVALEQGTNFDDEYALAYLAQSMRLQVEVKEGGLPLYLLAGKDVTAALRSPRVNNLVSQVAEITAVRKRVTEQLKKIGMAKNIVMDGRDVGTVILPHAAVKIFLTADLITRAERRQKELEGRGFTLPLSAVKEKIRQRDQRDSERQLAPLIPAADANIIDTTNLTIDEVVAKIIALAEKRLNICWQREGTTSDLRYWRDGRE